MNDREVVLENPMIEVCVEALRGTISERYWNKPCLFAFFIVRITGLVEYDATIESLQVIKSRKITQLYYFSLIT